jgi:hypothetical protein
VARGGSRRGSWVEAARRLDAAHRLRLTDVYWLHHTDGTRLPLADLDLRTILMKIGHTNICATMQYTESNQESLFEQLDRALRWGPCQAEKVGV